MSNLGRAFESLQVRDDLSNVDTRKLLDGLELDDQFAPDQQVDSPFTDAESLVLDGERNLTLEWDVTPAQLDGERFFMNRFGEPRSEDLVHLERGIDDCARPIIKPLVWSWRFIERQTATSRPAAR